METIRKNTRLLIVAQSVDSEDPVLGFFHRWVEAFAPLCSSMEVVCLKEGTHTLPSNVTVHSLGKEKGVASRLTYALRFYGALWRLRGKYDAVFVHMNQEYVLLAGPFWRLMGKRVLLWRNHPKGGFLTDIAVFLASVVFCTSEQSYTKRFGKTRLMPAGIDTGFFSPADRQWSPILRIINVGRIAPVKHNEVIAEGLVKLEKAGPHFSFLQYGTALPKDKEYETAYFTSLRRLKYSAFELAGDSTQTQARDALRVHDVYVNATESGSFDKAQLEAMAAGCLCVSSNPALNEVLGDLSFKEGDATDLCRALRYLSELPVVARDALAKAQRSWVREHHSLDALIPAILKSI